MSGDLGKPAFQPQHIFKDSVDTEKNFINDTSSGKNEEPEIPAKPALAYLLVSILCCMIAFGGFVFGWDTGTISGFVNMSDFLERFGEQKADGTYYLSKIRMGLIVSIFNIGCCLGSLTLPKTADKMGRRQSLMITMVVYIVGILIQITTNDKWYQYFIGRIVSGFAVGSISVVCPLFISESAPKHLRGTLVSSYQLMITLGIFLGYCTNYGCKSYTNSAQWRIALGLCFLYALLMIAGMLFMKESPRYLIQNGRLDEARQSLAFSNKVSPEDPSIFTEVEEINTAIMKEAIAGKASWGELFSGQPKIFYRVVVGAILFSLQQLTGNNYFFYYGTTIFSAVGLEDSFQTSMILGGVNLISTFVSLYSVQKLGARKSLLYGAIGMTFCFLIFASLGARALYTHGVDAGLTSKSVGNGMIFLACLFIFFFATTWGPCCFVLVSEIYPIRIKSKAMGIATSANWFWGFLISFFTPFITGAIHFYYGYVFTGCLLFAIFFVYFCIPQTNNLSLEDVDVMYELGIPAYKSDNWIPPKRAVENVSKQYSKPDALHADSV